MSEAAAFASEAVFDEVFEAFASSFSDSTATVGAAGVSDSFCSGEENPVPTPRERIFIS